MFPISIKGRVAGQAGLGLLKSAQVAPPLGRDHVLDLGNLLDEEARQRLGDLGALAYSG
jgi:hypothetical protein